MATKPNTETRENTVNAYFKYIRELRTGVDGAVERLMELWDEDGTFEFAGAPPVTGSFHGAVAIRTLYQNRFKASGMPVSLEADRGPVGKASAKSVGKPREVALGVVDTEVHRIRTMDGKVVAGWTTFIGTADARGFQVSGSHTFAFKDGKISSLRIVVSPKADSAPNLNLEGLTITDIGRLALAAWPVV